MPLSLRGSIIVLSIISGEASNSNIFLLGEGEIATEYCHFYDWQKVNVVLSICLLGVWLAILFYSLRKLHLYDSGCIFVFRKNAMYPMKNLKTLINQDINKFNNYLGAF